MSKKIKGVILGSSTSFGVGLCEGDRASMKYQTPMQDYYELQKEVDMMRSRLDAGKRRRMILAAEVRFLQKRFGYFMKTKTRNSLWKEKLVQPPNLHKQRKHKKEFSRREANLNMLPPIPEVIPKKKQYISKVALRDTSQHDGKVLEGLTMTCGLSHKRRVDTGKNNLMRNRAPVLELNRTERMHANNTSSRNTLELNQGDNSSSGKELLSLGNRAPLVFDLNEISTGDEDFETNGEAVKFDKERRSIMDEVQKELMVSVCRNAGEGASRVGKRKISWQDPVALRV